MAPITISAGSPGISSRYPATLSATMATTGPSGSWRRRSSRAPSPMRLTVAAALTAPSRRPAAPSPIPLCTA